MEETSTCMDKLKERRARIEKAKAEMRDVEIATVSWEDSVGITVI